ncbi:MAG: trypsin-like serine peptidase [Bacteriovoracaceae bacterium]
MKSLKTTYVPLLCLSFSLPLLAQQRVVYGDDNRLDLNEHPLHTFRQMGSAVAAQIDNNKIIVTDEQNGIYGVLGQRLVDFGICEKERFSHQVSAIRCSGFMIAKDLLVTSAQCVQNDNDCKNYTWIFDYKLQSTSETAVKFIADQSYHCKQIVARTYDTGTKEDYAVIRVDREIVGRLPLKYRKNGVLAPESKLFTIGTSLGLPLKISDQGMVLSNNGAKYFMTNLDTYGGAAGSPVINQETLEVEGIFTGGEKDFTFNPELNCSESKKCENDGSNCQGEKVTRITSLANLNFRKLFRRRP